MPIATRLNSVPNLGFIAVLQQRERESVNIPIWIGVSFVMIGGGLLLVGLERKT